MNVRARPLAEINAIAIDLLVKAMGPVDAIRFINQFTVGSGDYTAERPALFSGKTLEQIIAEIKQQAR